MDRKALEGSALLKGLQLRDSLVGGWNYGWMEGLINPPEPSSPLTKLACPCQYSRQMEGQIDTQHKYGLASLNEGWQFMFLSVSFWAAAPIGDEVL